MLKCHASNAFNDFFVKIRQTSNLCISIIVISSDHTSILYMRRLIASSTIQNGEATKSFLFCVAVNNPHKTPNSMALTWPRQLSSTLSRFNVVVNQILSMQMLEFFFFFDVLWANG